MNWTDHASRSMHHEQDTTLDMHDRGSGVKGDSSFSIVLDRSVWRSDYDPEVTRLTHKEVRL